jgi:hypothetical protein
VTIDGAFSFWNSLVPFTAPDPTPDFIEVAVTPTGAITFPELIDTPLYPNPLYGDPSTRLRCSV